MARIIVRSNYDFMRRFTFKLDGAAEDLSTSTIKCSIKNADKTTELVTDTVMSAGATGADWLNGLVVIQFTATQLASLTPQSGYIEVAVTKSGLRLPYEDIPIVIETGYTIS